MIKNYDLDEEEKDDRWNVVMYKSDARCLAFTNIIKHIFEFLNREQIYYVIDVIFEQVVRAEILLLDGKTTVTTFTSLTMVCWKWYVTEADSNECLANMYENKGSFDEFELLYNTCFGRPSLKPQHRWPPTSHRSSDIQGVQTANRSRFSITLFTVLWATEFVRRLEYLNITTTMIALSDNAKNRITCLLMTKLVNDSRSKGSEKAATSTNWCWSTTKIAQSLCIYRWKCKTRVSGHQSLSSTNMEFICS